MAAPSRLEPVASPGCRRRPRLAVLIPVFNGQRGLERSLASLRSEAVPFEVFVVDDGSAPPMVVPRELAYPVTLIRLPDNRGITAALNAGLERILSAGFEYIGRLDADDISLPGRFAAQMEFLDQHPCHAVVGTQAHVTNEQGRHLYVFRPPTDHDALMCELHYRNPMCHPSVMIRSSALRAVGLYTDDYLGGEDYDLWLRLARHYKLANLDQVFLLKEAGSASITSRRFRLGLNRLRLQLDNFNPRSIHAYLGIARSLALLLVSRGMLLRFMRLQTLSRPS